MQNNHAPTDSWKEAEDRIDWILAHPGVSAWLKSALRGARDRHPVDVLNDLELLGTLLRLRSHAQLDQVMHASRRPISDPQRGDGSPDTP